MPQDVFRSTLTRSRRRSLIATRQFWWIALVALVWALWHDHAPPPELFAADAPAAESDEPQADESPEKDASPNKVTGPINPIVGGHGEGHTEPVAPVLAAIVLMLLLAKIGGDLFERMGLPAVLGELVLGVLLGNIEFLTGSDFLAFMQPPVAGGGPTAMSVGAALQILAGIGVVLLLFEVGLESTVRQMMSVGTSSLAVALLGVIAPMFLGFYVSQFFFDDWQRPAFIGATLCATSVGITARVLKDLNRGHDPESRIILGAAVLDDILGLIILAVVSGVILATAETGSAGVPWGDIGAIVGWAVLFLGGALILGALSLPKVIFTVIGKLHGHHLLIATALMICFGMAYLAHLVGLAPIIGAFAAGLILERAHYRDLETRENVELETSLHPLTALLVPVFFVLTGMGVKLSAMADPSTWLLAGTLTVVAIIGKQICSLGVFQKGVNRFAVGVGMVPRGEVGLIFADQGRRLIVDGEPVIDTSTFSAIIVMVMVTTLIGPPLLKWSLNRNGPPGEQG